MSSLFGGTTGDPIRGPARPVLITSRMTRFGVSLGTIATFGGHIAHVFLMCTQEQVVWAHTARVVAMMAYREIIGGD